VTALAYYEGEYDRSLAATDTKNSIYVGAVGGGGNASHEAKKPGVDNHVCQEISP